MSIPDSSIQHIKPLIKAIDPQEIENQLQLRKPAHQRNIITSKVGSVKQCCICGNIPTHTATYQIEGASVIERYCSKCVEKTFH